MLWRLVRVRPSLSSITVLRAYSKTMMNRYGARGSPWRTSVLILNIVVSLSGVSTTAEVFLYIICMALTIFFGMPYAYRIQNSLFLSTKSKSFLKSMKIMAASFWRFLISLMRERICEDVDLFPKYVSLQNFNKSFLNLGSCHTSMEMPSSPGVLPSLPSNVDIC